MILLIQQIINGLVFGSIYALIAVGFGIVLSTMRVLNLAQGVYATWGALAAYYVSDSLGVSFYIALVVSAVAGAAVAVFVDQLAFQPLRGRTDGAQLLAAIVTSMGMWIGLREAASIASDSQPLGFPPGEIPNWKFHIGDVQILGIQVVCIVVALVFVSATYVLLQKTKLGAAIRAVGYDVNSAAISGVNPRAAIIIGAAVAGASTGLAGGLAAGTQGGFDFTIGDTMMVLAFAAVIIGGFSDVRACAVGGLVVGMLQILSAQYISGTLRDGVVFVAMLAFLLVRPRGLLGRAEAERA